MVVIRRLLKFPAAGARWLLLKLPVGARRPLRSVLAEAKDQAPAVTLGAGGIIVGWILALHAVPPPRPDFWSGWTIAAVVVLGAGVGLWIWKVLTRGDDPQIEKLRDEIRSNHQELVERLGLGDSWTRRSQTGTSGVVEQVSPPEGNV